MKTGCADGQDSSHDYPDCPPGTETLPAWLLQQIAEEDERTQALLSAARDTNVMLRDPKLLGRRIPGWHDWPDVERMCRQRLAELAAMREAVNACEEDLRQRGTGALDGQVDRATWDVVASLGSAFAGQPGYQERWRP